MDLIKIIGAADPNVKVFFLTAIAGLVSWIVKGLLEGPIQESKSTFEKFVDRRIEILSEILTRLKFIAYFPTVKESKIYKQQIQDIILRDGKVGYINKLTLESILRISIEAETNEKLLIATIQEIEDDLFAQISKIHEQISFYRRFSNHTPIKRLIGFSMLAADYAVSFLIVAVIVIGVCYTAYKIYSLMS